MPESERFFNSQESEKNKEFIEIENILVEPTFDYSRLIRESHSQSTISLNMNNKESREAYFSSYNELFIKNYNRYKSSLGKPEDERNTLDKEISLYWETLKSKITGKI